MHATRRIRRDANRDEQGSGKIQVLAVLVVFSVSVSVTNVCGWADGPADNIPSKVRPIPREGIEVPGEVDKALRAGLSELNQRIETIQQEGSAFATQRLPDVIIFERAVRGALEHNEFFKPGEFETAQALVKQGIDRAEQLSKEQADWEQETGLVVRGFRSAIDGTVQPYGLVIPTSYDLENGTPIPLDVWFHGRGETLSELNFLDVRQRAPGVFQPEDAIVVHPYGRYSNANKFAGETDVLEAIKATEKAYSIDKERIAVRGFSMGGASAWQIAVHYPSMWVAANPGAGFSETPDFLQTFQQETLEPFWWQAKLWRWYDATEWAGNLRHCPTVAYSGANDIQRQAADIMERAALKHGLQLVHVIGPDTGHKYEANAAERVEAVVRRLSREGRERNPPRINFTTYTLRYSKCAWVEILGLEEHWEAGTVRAALESDQILVETQGVTGLKLKFEPGDFPYREPPTIKIRSALELGASEQEFDSSEVVLSTDRSFELELHWKDGAWHRGQPTETLRKKPGLQGPIDDALMEGFLFVRPTGEPASKAVNDWAVGELERAQYEWRRHFRGVARVKDDRDVTDEDLRKYHVVLWGDASSNLLWRRIADRLPIKWTDGRWQVGDQTFDGQVHAPIFVYPNPLAADRYVVANSSFTFREYAYLNNARQVPMLPDWAIIDISEPPNTVWPGRVVLADFFDEAWQVRLPIRKPVKVPPPQPQEFEHAVSR